MSDFFPRIPVHVVSGHLGVGKTTAVRHLLERRAESERIAVIVNEYGDIGIDGALLSDCLTCVLKEVPGGCVCCTALADLEVSVEEILDLVAPTRLVIEPTGLAKASEIVDIFRKARFESRFELRPVLTLLDPQLDYRAAYASDPSFRDQVDSGDILVIHRTDLASEDEIRAAEEFARALEPPKLDVVRAAKGALPDRVFERTLPDDRAVRAFSRSAHGHATAEHVGKGFAHGPERLFDVDRLEAFLRALEKSSGRQVAPGAGGAPPLLACDVARAKGIFRTTTGWRVYEIAGGRLSSAPTEYRRDNRFDAILKRPAEADLAALAAGFEETLVPLGAPLLEVEDESGLLRAFDVRALEAHGPTAFATGALGTSDAAPLPPGARAMRLSDVVAAAGSTSTGDWLWLLSDYGRFASGGPRDVVERGFVVFGGEPPLGPEDGGPFVYLLPDAAAAGREEEVDRCRRVEALCTLRVGVAPGEGEGAAPLVPEEELA